jgi:adenosine deaminase
VSRDLGMLPKTQLHLHLAGAMRPATLREFAEGYGVPVPSDDARKLKDWVQFQGLYDAARAVIRTPDDIARVLTEAAADDAVSHPHPSSGSDCPTTSGAARSPTSWPRSGSRTRPG